MSRNSFKKHYSAYLFSLPAITFILIFLAGPLISSFCLSFTDFHLVYSRSFNLVGFRNYFSALDDPYFLNGLANTLTYTVLHVPACLILCLVIALLIHSSGKYGRWCQAMIFIPVLIPEAMGAVIFTWLFSERFGVINQCVSAITGQTFHLNWLGKPGWSMAAIVLASYWGIGTSVILLTAGLAGIRKDLYEAAAIDGAGPWARFRAVTLPSLKHTLVVVSLLSVIHSLKVFALPYIMTKGGPGTSTLMLYHWIFKNAFEYFNLGYACAMAILLGLIVILFTGSQMLLSRKEDRA